MSASRGLLAFLFATLILHVAALAFLTGDGTWIEHWYARGLYPRIGPVIAFVPAQLPFSLAAVGIIALCVWALAIPVLNVRRWLGRSIRLGRAVLRTLTAWAVAAILLFHGFYLFWGYNYLRPPLEQRLGLAAVDESEAARVDVSQQMIRRAVAAIVPVEPWDRHELDALIDVAIDSAVRDLEGRPPPVVSPLKGDLGTGYLALMGQGGVINPLTLEAHVDFDQPPFALAFTAAHEKAHLAGFARERDANFVAWYALTHAADLRLQFAGHFGVAGYFVNAETRALAQPLAPYFRQRNEYRSSRVSEPLSRTGLRAYGVYMRANRMQAGLADYGEVASLIHRWTLQAD